MRYFIKIATLSFAIITYYLTACKRDIGIPSNMPVSSSNEAIPAYYTSQNYIKNPNFEDSAGNPLFNYWYLNGNPSNPMSNLQTDSLYLSNDVPTKGGKWSLILHAWAVENWVETYVTNQQGTNIYQLTVWMKYVKNDFPTSEGEIYLGLKNANNTLILKSIKDSTNLMWTQYTIIDTLSLSLTDTIVVGFSPGMSGNPPWNYHHVLFDYVELIKIIP